MITALALAAGAIVIIALLKAGADRLFNHVNPSKAERGDPTAPDRSAPGVGPAEPPFRWTVHMVAAIASELAFVHGFNVQVRRFSGDVNQLVSAGVAIDLCRGDRAIGGVRIDADVLDRMTDEAAVRELVERGVATHLRWMQEIIATLGLGAEALPS